MHSTTAATGSCVTIVFRPAQAPPPGRRWAIEIGVPAAAEALPIPFHTFATDGLSANRAANFTLGLQKRFKTGEHREILLG